MSEFWTLPASPADHRNPGWLWVLQEPKLPVGKRKPWEVFDQEKDQG